MEIKNISETSALEVIKQHETFDNTVVKVIHRYLDLRDFAAGLKVKTCEGAEWTVKTVREATSGQLVGAFHTPYHIITAVEAAKKKQEGSSVNSFGLRRPKIS